jgi:hypothetical protein
MVIMNPATTLDDIKNLVAAIRKEYLADPDIPKAPIVIVEGTSGTGRSGPQKNISPMKRSSQPI